VYRYVAAEYPLPEDLNTSALRFTWTYKNPGYYQEGAKAHDKKAVVIITDSVERTLPGSILQKVEGLSAKRTFEISDNVFRHKTLVTVFH
ncbi:MAG: hypothetical protein Q8K68_09190, partial [Nitrospirota bacterium]|nr:hypothetical protein [Nitrospirota bacterium]